MKLLGGGANKANRDVVVFLSLVIAFVLVIDPFLEHSGVTQPLEELSAGIISGIQGSLGIENYRHINTVYYPDIGLNVVVGPLCLGLREISLFLIAVVVLGKAAKRIKALAAFLIVIFAQNIARMLLIYPFAKSVGFEGMVIVHDAMWQFGQAAFLLAMLALWFWLFREPSKDKRAKAKE